VPPLNYQRESEQAGKPTESELWKTLFADDLSREIPIDDFLNAIDSRKNL
jgi:hypothetical protein